MSIRRHKIRKKEYDRVVGWLKERIAGADEKAEEKMEVAAADRAHAVPEGVLPKIGWARHGPFELRKVAHGREAIFVKEGGELKELVHEGNVDGYLRDAMLLPSSDVPLARDTGYHMVQKRTVGISRRMMQRFINKQEVVQLMRQQNPVMKQAGRPLEGKGYLEIDLIEAKGADIGKWVHHPVKNFYFISMIDRLTGWLEVERTVKKDVKSVAPKIRRMLGKMKAALGIPKIQYIRSDAGSEFKAETQEVFKELKIRSKFVKSGNRIENANRNYQRIWYQLMRLGRGDLNELTNQALGIFNNTKSRINGYTPLEALKVDAAILKEKFNNSKSRRRIAKYKAEPIEIGDKARYLIDKVVGKHKKALAYKSYRGLHWSPEVYTVVKINSWEKNRANQTLQEKNATDKFYVAGAWRFRDVLLKVPGVDKQTKDRVDEMHNRTLAEKRKKIGDLALS